VNILSQLNIIKLKNKELLAALAIVSVVFVFGCVKDNFVETVGVCPIVVSTNPANGTTEVPLNQIIAVTFNEKMNDETINQASFKINGPSEVLGIISYAGNTAYFRPVNPLLPSTTYIGTIESTVKDLLGNVLQTDYIWTFSTSAFFVDLKTAAMFGIIAGTAVINSAGQSEIRNMDVGISPGNRSSIIGFPPAILVNGNLFASDDLLPLGVAAMLLQAKLDLTEAYRFAEGLSFPAAIPISGDLGGRTLTPGIYKSNSSLLIQSGNLTLDAQGDANAVWIFQIASGLTTVGGAGGNVVLTGGAKANNVTWQTGSSATIGEFTSFKGNVLALTSVTLNSGASAEGRMLAQNGAVVLTNTNIIYKP